LEELERDLPCRFRELEGWVIRSDPHRLTWTSGGHRIEGRGWNTLIPVVGPRGNTGLFFHDSAISERPMDPGHQDVVALYCALLGQLAGARSYRPDSAHSELRRILEFAEDLVSCPTRDELHRKVAEGARELAGATKAALLIDDPRSGRALRTWTAFQDGSVVRHRNPEIESPDEEPGDNSRWCRELTAEGRRLGSLLFEAVQPPAVEVMDQLDAFVLLASRILEHAESSAERDGSGDRGAYLDLVAGGIAHDFNNLLAAALGNIELLLEVTDLDRSRVRQRLEDARSACLRGRSLARRLLTLTRGGTPVIRPVDTIPFLMEAVKSSNLSSGLRWNIRNPGQAWSLLSDEAQLGQVIQNLVVNACQWQGSEPELEISVSNREVVGGEVHPLGPGRYVQIEFQDRGPGVPESIRPRIFDPYFSTRKEGSGLGLATCRTILERHHGSIECLPSAHGALFRILLPATEAEPQRPAPVEGTSAGSTLAGRRILVMDDEPALRETVRDILESQGSVVETAAEGRTAIDRWVAAAADGKPFDIGLFDLAVAGGMGGAEAARRILSDDPSARIVVCSGWSEDPALSEASNLGLAGSLAKPFRMADLLDMCEKALRGR